MLELLAETAWTPTLIVGGIISGGVILAKLLPWPKKSGGNGSSHAAADGEARGEMKAKISAHDDELKRQNKTDEDQWTAINETRKDIVALQTTADRTASDVKEIKGDLKEVLKRGNDE